MNAWERGKPTPKPSRTARKKATVEARKGRTKKERDNKGLARKRDRYRCRFPLCGCKSLGLALDARLEVSHDRHKGMGGNPLGDRSGEELLITLCLHRHQDGIFSRHKGTLRTRYLTPAKNNGPVAWDLDVVAVLQHCHGPAWPMTWSNELASNLHATGWFEVAREKAVGELEPLTVLQTRILKHLAEMNL